MKKIQKILMLVLISTIGVMASVSYATGTLSIAKEDSNNTNWSGWKDEMIVKNGDNLYFNINYYLAGRDVSNIRLKLENLNDRYFKKLDEEDVYSFNTASDAPTLKGSVKLIFNDNLKLRYDSFTFLESSCDNRKCESDGGSENNDIISKKGYFIGSRKKGDFGNVVVKFEAVYDENDLRLRLYNPVEFSSNTVRLKGKVIGENNIKTWFVISKKKSLKCSRASIMKDVSGKVNNKKYFYRNINNLVEDTNYYYRACAESKNGRDVESSIKRFRTAKKNRNIEAVVKTNNPENITSSSAVLNGHVILNRKHIVDVNFVYGTDLKYLHLSTKKLELKKDSYFQSVQGLLPNQKYYYQAIVMDSNDNLIDKGNVMSFKTNKKTQIKPLVIKKIEVKKKTTKRKVKEKVNGGGQSASIFGSGFIFSEYTFLIALTLITVIMGFIFWRITGLKQKTKVEIKNISEEDRNKFM